MINDMDSASLLTYAVLLVVLAMIISTIFYIIKKKKQIKDVKINPLAPIFGLLFFIGLWLADLTTLYIGTTGFGTMVGLNPISSSKVPALFVWFVSVLAMFFINYFFLEINHRKENKNLYSFNKILVYTQLLGLIVFVISSLAMSFFGYSFYFSWILSS